MPEMSKWVTPSHMGEPNASKKIMKLGKKITDVAAHMVLGCNENDPEYWGLAEIITEEQAEIALTFKKRHPYTFAEVCELNADYVAKYGKERLQEQLDQMCYVGLMEYDFGYHYDHNGRTAPQSEKRYILGMFVPGSAELFNMEELGPEDDYANPRLEEHPAVGSFFERMTYLPLKGVTQAVPMGGSGIGMHVIPVEKEVQMQNSCEDLEKLSYWLKKYEGHIGVGRCSCRASRKAIGDGCPDDDLAWCIGVGDFADYCRETGKGHDITVEEALEILQRGEDLGYVHQVTNIDGENKIFGICNCNLEICNALRTSQLFNTPNMSRSAYVAHVDAEKCVACGRCVEYCPAGACRLGQKLPKKDGTKVKYPQMQLPDNHVWIDAESRYSENYRDDARVNTHETGTAPCKGHCPAHISIEGYLDMAADGRYDEALALIKQKNPFPAVCGRVCNKRCEEACTRGTIDDPVAIDAVKKFISDRELKAEHRYVPKIKIASNRYERWAQKVAIIGGGPAGLSAAFFLAEKGYLPTVFEKSEEPGGMLRYGIPSYKLGKDVLKSEIEVIEAMGVEIKTGVEVGKDITLDELRAEGYKAFYVAIGCSAGRRPGVPGDDAEGTFTAIDYLHDANCGNAPFDGTVVVIGGGNVAIDASRVSARNGASKVYQFALETERIMPASDEEILEAREDGVELQGGWGPKEILTEDGKVTGIVLKKCTKVYNGAHKFCPQYDEETTMEVKCDRVIFAVGQASVWGDLLAGETPEKNGPTLKCDSFTQQVVGAPDLFIGGDVLTGPKFAIDAIGQGQVVAESMHRYVQGGDEGKVHMKLGRNRNHFIDLDKTNISVVGYDNGMRNDAGVNSALDAHTFEEVQLTLSEEQVKLETARCLKCGKNVVDPNKCIGCGVCTTKCDFDAIHLRRDNPGATCPEHMITAEKKFGAMIPHELKRIKNIITKVSDADVAIGLDDEHYFVSPADYPKAEEYGE